MAWLFWLETVACVERFISFKTTHNNIIAVIVRIKFRYLILLSAISYYNAEEKNIMLSDISSGA